MSHTNNKEVKGGVEAIIEYVIKSRDDLGVYNYVIRETLTKMLHQELQKARHDWLREEIVKLEGMKQPITIEDRVESAFASIEWDKYNQALQTIIDRYSSELDQPTDVLETVKKDWDKQADDLINK